MKQQSKTIQKKVFIGILCLLFCGKTFWNSVI